MAGKQNCCPRLYNTNAPVLPVDNLCSLQLLFLLFLSLKTQQKGRNKSARPFKVDAIYSVKN